MPFTRHRVETREQPGARQRPSSTSARARAPPSLRSPSSGSLVHYFSTLLTSLLWTPMTRVCGKRWERSGGTKGLAAINSTRATFTIIQRDRGLIALARSRRRAGLPLRRHLLRSRLTSPSLDGGGAASSRPFCSLPAFSSPLLSLPPFFFFTYRSSAISIPRRKK